MQIVIPDDCFRLFEGSHALGRLRALGDVHYYTENAESEVSLRERLKDAEIILTTRYQTDFKTTDLLDHIPHLEMISVMGTRPRMIDMGRANERGIVVSTTPAASASSVAEHTMMLILALAKRMPLMFPAMKEGGWPQDLGIELAGKTLGLIGFGHIARSGLPHGLGFRYAGYHMFSFDDARACAGGGGGSGYRRGMSRRLMWCRSIFICRRAQHPL